MGDTEEFAVATTLSRLRRHSNDSSQDMSDLEKRGHLVTGKDLRSTEKSVEKAPEKAPEKGVEKVSAKAEKPASPSTVKTTGTESPNGSTSTNESKVGTEQDAGRSEGLNRTSDESTQSRRESQVQVPAPSQGGQKQWKNVLLTATSIMLTKDARKKVRQVLSLLKLASEQLNTKVNALRIAMEEDADHDKVTPKISRVAIRNDIINTIKKCVTMFSTLATNTLPSVARARVRNTILRLPTKWANQLDNAANHYDRKTESAVLALATETLDAITNITNILTETMDRADSWVEKLPNFRLGKRRRPADEEETEGTTDQGESKQDAKLKRSTRETPIEDRQASTSQSTDIETQDPSNLSDPLSKKTD